MGNHLEAHTPTYKANIWTKTWPENCRVGLVLKHFGGHILSRFLFIFLPVCGGRGSLARFWGKTPWVDSACADCAGFLVLGVVGAPLQASSRSLGVPPPPTLVFAALPLGNLLGCCCSQLPHHPCNILQQNRKHSISFCSTRGHAPIRSHSERERDKSEHPQIPAAFSSIWQREHATGWSYLPASWAYTHTHIYTYICCRVKTWSKI